jgi:O-antigen/teichoic acid export membrane protein
MTTAMRILGLVLPFIAVERVMTAAMRGLGVNAPTAVIDGVGVPVMCLIVGGLAAVLSPSLVTFTIAWGVPWIGAAGVGLIWTFRVVHARAGVGPWWRGVAERRVLTRDFWSFTWARGLAQIFQVGTVWIVVLLMGLLGSARDAGVYGAVSRVAIIGSLVLQSINLVLAPRIPAALATGDREGAERLYQVATAWAVVSGFPVYIVLALFPNTFVGVFGARFSGGALALSVLCVAMLWNLATGPVTVVLVMAGRSRWNLYNAAATLIVCAGTAAVLIPRYGVTGGALAWAAAILVENGLPLIEVRWLMGLHPFSRATAFAVGAALASFGGVGIVLRLAGASGFVGALLTVVPAMVVYVILLRRSPVREETRYVAQALADTLRRRETSRDRRIELVPSAHGARSFGFGLLAIFAAVCAIAAGGVTLTNTPKGVLVGTGASSDPVATVPETATTSVAPAVVIPSNGYSVAGTKILDPAGKVLVPYGNTIYGLSYSDWTRLASVDLDAIRATAVTWHGNVVRLQISPTSLFHVDPYDPDMLRQLDTEIQVAEQYPMAVILDLMNGNDRSASPPALPDDMALKFWRFMAARYSSDKRIWFELFDAPQVGVSRDAPAAGKVVQLPGGASGLQYQSTTDAWNAWKKGGNGFAGMQDLYDAVRGTGAGNIVIADSIESASTISGVIPLKGSNIVYGLHGYFQRDETPALWGTTFGEVSSVVPVLVVEWSQYASQRAECTVAAPALVPKFLSYLQAHGIGLITWGLEAPGALVVSFNDFVHPTSFDPAVPYVCSGLPTSQPPQGAGQLVMDYFAKYSLPAAP